MGKRDCLVRQRRRHQCLRAPALLAGQRRVQAVHIDKVSHRPRRVLRRLPSTGFAVYDTYSLSGWNEFGVPVRGSPQWASIIADADQARMPTAKPLSPTRRSCPSSTTRPTGRPISTRSPAARMGRTTGTGLRPRQQASAARSSTTSSPRSRHAVQRSHSLLDFTLERRRVRRHVVPNHGGSVELE